MENRRIVETPVHEGPVKARPDDFEPVPTTNNPDPVDTAAAGTKPPVCSYSLPPHGDGCESGERH